MSDLTIIRTIAQFDTFDVRLITAYCRAEEEEVITFLENHHYLFERAGGRHSVNSLRLRIRDHESFQHRLAELGATEPPTRPPEPATGLTEQLQVLENHLIVATLTIQKATESPPAFRSEMAAQVEACLEQSLDVLRTAVHPEYALGPLFPSSDLRVLPTPPPTRRTSAPADSPEPHANRQVRLVRHEASDPPQPDPQRARERSVLQFPVGLLRRLGALKSGRFSTRLYCTGVRARGRVNSILIRS